MVAKMVAYQSAQYTPLYRFVGEEADELQKKGYALEESTKSHRKYDK
jgi:hypothetical protein